MAMTVEQPESLEGGGGKYLDKAGLYHFVVTGVDENPADKNSKPMDAVKVNCTVLAGTNPEQKDRTIDIILWNPSPDDSNEKRIQRRKQAQTAFCLATCLIGHFQPGVKVSVEPKDAIGRQVVAKIVHAQKKNEQTGEYEDTKFFELCFSDIYHVDHEWVKKNNVPLDQAAIACIHKSLRKLPPASILDGGSANGHANGNGAVVATAAVDVGDV